MSGEMSLLDAMRAVDAAYVGGRSEAYRFAAMFVRVAEEQTHDEMADVIEKCAHRSENPDE